MLSAECFFKKKALIAEGFLSKRQGGGEPFRAGEA